MKALSISAMNRPLEESRRTNFQVASSSSTISHEEKNVARVGSRGVSELCKKWSCDGGEMGTAKGCEEEKDLRGKWTREAARAGNYAGQVLRRAIKYRERRIVR